MSRSPFDFAFYQLTARVFLVGQWALCMMYAAEEFPADRRGFAIGVIQAATALGSITCALVAPALLNAPYGWRTVYFVGVIPLLLLAYARRNLKETRRFEDHVDQGGRPHGLTDILRSPYRTRVFQVALVWALTYACSISAVVFWKEFAVGERGFTDGQVGTAVALASAVSLPFIFAAG